MNGQKLTDDDTKVMCMICTTWGAPLLSAKEKKKCTYFTIWGRLWCTRTKRPQHESVMCFYILDWILKIYFIVYDPRIPKCNHYSLCSRNRFSWSVSTTDSLYPTLVCLGKSYCLSETQYQTISPIGPCSICDIAGQVQHVQEANFAC